MARVLVMEEHDVDAAERDAYVASLGARRAHARSAGANFWVFEHSATTGRFLEFVEAGSVETLAAVHAAPVSHWREVEGV